AKANGEAAYVVRVPGAVDVQTLRRAPSEADFTNGCTTQSKRDGRPHAGFQSVEAQVAGPQTDPAELTEDTDPQGVDDLALIADLVDRKSVVQGRREGQGG